MAGRLARTLRRIAGRLARAPRKIAGCLARTFRCEEEILGQGHCLLARLRGIMLGPVDQMPWDYPDHNEVSLRSFDEGRGSSAPSAEEITPAISGAVGESSCPYRYDVFLSFRGEDTRNGFVGHLHAALRQRGIAAFMDDEELRKGEEIGPAILRAIGESGISIVVFSEDYASSGWCLDELVRIVECMDMMGQIVWPVFYKVDPSEVRRQTGRYGQALIKHEERLKSKGGDSEKVERWREALTKAANISGRHLVDERESDFIQSIVKSIWANTESRSVTCDPIYFPADLRWLEWPEYSSPSVPFKCKSGHRKLVGLDLSKSSVCILGKEFKHFRNLRCVDFSHCTLLREIPDVSSLPNLESLDLQECSNLVEVHQSLGRLDKLVYLNFLNCCNLSCFPSSLKSRSLENLILRGCSKLSRFPDILVPVKCLKTLALHETAIEELPSSVVNLVELKELYLRDCTDLKNLPCSIYTLQHLELIFVDGCSQLNKFPKCLCESSDCTNVSLPLALPNVINLNVQRCSLSELSFLENLHCISSLTILDLSENKFVSLPTCIGQFTKLQQLCLTLCKQLREILALPPNITSLQAKGCESLETCADLSNVLRYNPDESPWLRRIDFSGCQKLIQDQCSSNCNMLSIEGLLGETRVDIFYPGSKVPKWFAHQSTRGLIRFPVFSESYPDIAGLAFCAIVGSANRKEASISCEIQLFVNKQETYGCVDCFSSLESDHIWLLYIPRRMMWGLDAKLLNHRSQFTVLFRASEETLRSCGVHLVYKLGKQGNDTKIDKSIDPLNSNTEPTSSHVRGHKRKERFSDS
ncbi:hypothetical protein NL676_033534 [Syzygium grande]|nr:hypothetical protein NL676_033534 [Syzygium grande]